MNEYFLHEIFCGEGEAVEKKVGVEYAGLEINRCVAVMIVDFLQVFQQYLYKRFKKFRIFLTKSIQYLKNC